GQRPTGGAARSQSTKTIRSPQTPRATPGRANGGENRAWQGSRLGTVLCTARADDAARRRFAAAARADDGARRKFAAAAPELVVATEAVPAVQLDCFRGQRRLALVREPRHYRVDHGVAAGLFRRERVVAAE